MILILIVAGSCENRETNSKLERSSGYGVFLSLEGENLINISEGYKTVVFDAQYLSLEEIQVLQDRGQEVYSYINIGSLETFRPYYEEYKNLVIKPYVDWEEEFWIDITDEEWQAFIRETLVKEILEKNIDGFWVDNVDVYGEFPNEESYRAVEKILKDIMTHGKLVIINGGNEFVELYLERNEQVNDILTGVNQETVFTSINFEDKNFKKQAEEDQSYYLEYLNSIDRLDKDVFLLEYTMDNKLIKKIQAYAKKRGWKFYISDSIELN